jgi:transcription antitermination factor NusA-like protein
VRTELCQFCLRSGILCSKCKRKVERGEVSQVDLEIGRLLTSIEDKYPPLQDVYFHKAVEADGVLAVFVSRGDIARILSYGGKIIRFLERKTGRTVRVLEKGSDDRKFLEDLFAPMSILTINRIWLPDGTTETRVILRGRERRKTSRYIRALRKIAKESQGISLRIEFAG